MPILLHALVAAGYVAVAVAIWRAAVRNPSSKLGYDEAPYRLSAALRAGIVVAWVIHAWLLRDAALVDGTWRFGFALALSATMWCAVALFWFESFIVPLVSVWLLILPLAALCALLPLAFPGSLALGQLSGADGGGYSPWLPVHLVVALAAYGLLTIAAVHALYMAALDRWLHRTRGSAWPGANDAALEGRGRIEQSMLGPLPPLLTMERILFRLIGIGFALLTLTVLSGIVFSEALFGKPIRFDHKTIFTLIAWATFGALLIGRVARGWRGRLALSWTLGGFAMLFLAYAGSRFVLEVVLHRV
ncbi:MAG: cytochrome c biogenesis protein CcsA [Burkholderiaceae bacterium]